MTLARPPWTPALSDGCSAPVMALLLDADLRAACHECRACCLAHDRAYYEGGTWADKLKADVELFNCMAACAKDDGVALSIFDAVYRYGRSHWYVPPALERSPQEGP
jgi:hypothetical protein